MQKISVLNVKDNRQSAEQKNFKQEKMNLTNRVENLLQRYSEEQILRAIVNSYKAIISTKNLDRKNNNSVIKKAKPVSETIEPVPTGDHPPCSSCGGTFFLRTGTCHVCQTCGTSQGCS